MYQLKAKSFLGRKVREEKIFIWGKKTPFGALYEAAQWLHDRGFYEGSLSHPEPIGFVVGKYTLPQKWHNLSKEDKAQLSGIISSDNFREGNVKVIFFED